MNTHEVPPGPPLAAEIRQALTGALRLFLFDNQALRYFNTSIQGFWRSFLAAPICLPIFMLTLVLQDRLLRATPGATDEVKPLQAMLTSELLTYPFSWVLFPLAMIGLAKLLKITDRYVPYMIVYNWAAVVIAILTLLPNLLYGMGLLGTANTAALALGINLIVIVYLWVIARIAARVTGPTAAALVAIDLLLSFLFEGLLRQLSV